MTQEELSTLLDWLSACELDPVKFADEGFPWGEEGTELAEAQGLEPWQRELLCYIRDRLIEGSMTIFEAIQTAVTSGHGIGKSAIVAIIILWAIATKADTRGVITANTETQLKTKTWAELGKWYRLFIGRELFKFTATAIFSADPDHERTWRVDMVPWSERNTEAFAGLHNKNLRVLLVMDEASAIPDMIWEVAEGALTDANTQIIWCVFGNPTQAKGRFRECFPGGKFAARWWPKKVDSRTVSLTNKALFEKWVADYGEDSDFVRVRVRGEFPRVGSMQFIGAELPSEAARREVDVHLHDPLVLGVDVARFGDDESVIYIRKGRDGRSIAPVVLRSTDTMTLAGRVAQLYSELRADAVFVDGGGVGGGVVDRLRQLQVPTWDIQFGAKSDSTWAVGEDIRYANKRAEIWGAMRGWLKGGAIPDDKELVEQLTGPQYGYNVRNEIQLEQKADMKKRGLSSPDRADALALTFAYPVVAKNSSSDPAKPFVLPDYNPIETYEAA